MASVNYAFIQASIKVLMDAYCKKIITLQVEEKCVVGQGCSLIVVNSFTHWLYKNSEIQQTVCTRSIYPRVPGSTRIYSLLPASTRVYPLLPASTHVYPLLAGSTRVYMLLPSSTQRTRFYSRLLPCTRLYPLLTPHVQLWTRKCMNSNCCATVPVRSDDVGTCARRSVTQSDFSSFVQACY